MCVGMGGAGSAGKGGMGEVGSAGKGGLTSWKKREAGIRVVIL